MDNTYIVNVLLYSILISVFTPLVIISIYYAIAHEVLEKIVEPSFELKSERFVYLVFSYLIFSVLVLGSIDVVAGHFHVESADPAVKVLIPALIFVAIRCIVMFHSSRVAREHLGTIVFIMVVSGVIKTGYNASTMSFSMHFGAPITYSGMILLTAIVPLAGDSVLLFLTREGRILSRFVDHKVRLIDLTEELPIKVRVVFGRENIDMLIDDMIGNGDGELCLVTNTFNTVILNSLAIQKRREKGTVKIIGNSTNLASQNSQLRESLELLRRKGVIICPGSFDSIRLIIDCHKRVLCSFATAGYRGSHVGIYSSHPFVVSLFKSYFDTKCKSLKCENVCENIAPSSKAVPPEFFEDGSQDEVGS